MQVLSLMHFFLDWELLTAISNLCYINRKNLIVSLMRVKEATTVRYSSGMIHAHMLGTAQHPQ